MPGLKKSIKKVLKKQIARAKPKGLVGRGRYKVRKSVGTKVRGRGGYWSDFKNFFTGDRGGGSLVNKGLSSIGSALGGATGIPGASAVGSGAGSWLSRALGMGAYKVKKNSLMTENAGIMGTNMPPSFGSTKTGSDIIFSHREFVADVKSSQDFASTSYVINPGNPELFPWMHKVAILFEEYEMLGMILEYKTTSATAVGTTTSGMGVVLMATDYDCYDTNYGNKRAMEAAEFSSDGVPYQTFLHPIECDPKRNVLARNYVVPGITSVADAPGDARLSVLGNTTIATVGQQTDGDVIGELWVTYHVRLSRPILEDETSTQDIMTVWGSGVCSASGVITQSNTVSYGDDPIMIDFDGTGNAGYLSVNNFGGRGGIFRIDMVMSQTNAGTGTTAWTANSTNAATYFGCEDYVPYHNTTKSKSFNAQLGDLAGTTDPVNESHSGCFVNFDEGYLGSVHIPYSYLGNTGALCGYNVHVSPWSDALSIEEFGAPKRRFNRLKRRRDMVEFSLNKRLAIEETKRNSRKLLGLPEEKPNERRTDYDAELNSDINRQLLEELRELRNMKISGASSTSSSLDPRDDKPRIQVNEESDEDYVQTPHRVDRSKRLVRIHG